MKILAQFETPKASATAKGRVILVDLGEGYQPFVTWWENLDDGGRVWGHYFTTRQEAERDFVVRAARGY